MSEHTSERTGDGMAARWVHRSADSPAESDMGEVGEIEYILENSLIELDLTERIVSASVDLHTQLRSEDRDHIDAAYATWREAVQEWKARRRE